MSGRIDCEFGSLCEDLVLLDVEVQLRCISAQEVNITKEYFHLDCSKITKNLTNPQVP